MLLWPQPDLLWAQELKGALVIMQRVAHDPEHLSPRLALLDVGQQGGNGLGLYLGACRGLGCTWDSRVTEQ